jgi:lipoprotein NlpD
VRSFVLPIAVFALAALAGCAPVSKRPAPVSELTLPGKQSASAPRPPATAPAVKPSPRPQEAKGEFYVVKPGDTLFSIAAEHGVDYRELALWNGIETPSALRVGQQLRVVAPPGTAVAVPLRTPGGVDARPLGSAPGPSAMPLPLPGPTGPAASAAPGAVVSEPRAVRVPYSEQALAQLARNENAPNETRPEVRSEPRNEPPPPPPQRSDVRPEPRNDSANEVARGPDDLDWTWPTRGKIVGNFNDGTNKGIAIAGKLGQPIYASAPGRVIFSGTGIRGFGKLIVIKHNNTYLSVYAHNSELNVKEGQNVTKGQKIGEMGNSDADQVKLHFEIRRFGKPVDPLKLLPAG